MKPILLRSAFLFFGAIFQVSFVNTVFPSLAIVSPFLLASVVSITLFRGFSSSWQWAIVAGVLLDTLTLGRIGATALEYVLGAALLDFAAKKVVLNYHAEQALFFGGLLWVFDAIFRLVETLLLSSISGRTVSASSLCSQMQWITFFSSFPIAVAIYAFLFSVTLSFERYLDLFEREKVGRR